MPSMARQAPDQRLAPTMAQQAYAQQEAPQTTQQAVESTQTSSTRTTPRFGATAQMHDLEVGG
jgi:hypothetical protein